MAERWRFSIRLGQWPTLAPTQSAVADDAPDALAPTEPIAPGAPAKRHPPPMGAPTNSPRKKPARRLCRRGPVGFRHAKKRTAFPSAHAVCPQPATHRYSYSGCQKHNPDISSVLTKGRPMTSNRFRLRSISYFFLNNAQTAPQPPTSLRTILIHAGSTGSGYRRSKPALNGCSSHGTKKVTNKIGITASAILTKRDDLIPQKNSSLPCN